MNIITYPASRIVVPELHLEDLSGEGVGVLLGVAGGHGGEHQDALPMDDTTSLSTVTDADSTRCSIAVRAMRVLQVSN